MHIFSATSHFRLTVYDKNNQKFKIAHTSLALASIESTKMQCSSTRIKTKCFECESVSIEMLSFFPLLSCPSSLTSSTPLEIHDGIMSIALTLHPSSLDVLSKFEFNGWHFIRHWLASFSFFYHAYEIKKCVLSLALCALFSFALFHSDSNGRNRISGIKKMENSAKRIRLIQVDYRM